ncbi:ATP-binding protein, partial [Embleya sp. NPDC005575]|uniref:ATP-binding protein n=1 Tax=Embleya sp. NPDC005575 TaxID=3156892 RepID=UPI0033A2D632
MSFRTDTTASVGTIQSIRAILPGILTAAGIPAETADTVQLCTHELMANVARHIGEGAPLRLAVHAQQEWVAVEVHDRDGLRFPQPRPCDWAAGEYQDLGVRGLVRVSRGFDSVSFVWSSPVRLR